MSPSSEISPLSLNRLSLYLRCLRRLQEQGIARVSSKQLAERFFLSAALIRKDLAQFGEFGIRGVGYEVASLVDKLESLLGLDRQHRLVVVGMGRLGVALARYLEFNQGAFRVVAGLDSDPRKIGREVGHLTIERVDDLEHVVRRSGANIAIVTVPPESAQELCNALTAAGIQAILNFAPVQLEVRAGVAAKTVDVRIHLEELAFFLQAASREPSPNQRSKR
jgi:redox-sensing transcriptional repressor